MRKIIMAVVGAAVAFFGLFGVALNITPDLSPYSVIGSLLIVAAYVFTEFKKDWAAFREGLPQQANKWSDPGFYTALAASVLIPLLSAFGVEVSEQVVAIASAILAVIVPILISLFRKTEPV